MLRVLRVLILSGFAALVLAGGAAAGEGRRVALVIGSAKYTAWRSLNNPVKDAELIAQRFEALKFDTVERVEDQSYDAIRAKLRAFQSVARDADLVVIYYTGHGGQIGGKGYIVPGDAPAAFDLNAGLADNYVIAVDNLVGLANLGKSGLVFVDACRNNMGFDRVAGAGASKGVSTGLQIDRSRIGDRVLVQMSTQADETADDGAGDNSDFALSVDQSLLDDQSVSLQTLLEHIQAKTYEASKRTQKPAILHGENSQTWWATLDLTAEPINLPKPRTEEEIAAERDENDWRFAQTQGEQGVIEGYLAYLKAKYGPDLRYGVHRQAALDFVETWRQQRRPAGTIDEARRALKKLSPAAWKTLAPEALLDVVETLTTPSALELLSQQPPLPEVGGVVDQTPQQAMILQAAMYDRGVDGADPKPAQALLLYRRAAEARNPTALRIMAEFAHYGREGEPVRLEKAAGLYEQAAQGGDAFAQDRLASMYVQGLVPEKSRPGALELFQAAAAQEYGWGQCHMAAAHLGSPLLTKRDPHKAIELADKSALGDNYCGEMILGHIYLFGEGEQQKPAPTRGADLYAAAARHGGAEAQTSLGILQQNGIGMTRDLALAIANFEAAAKQGYAPAQYLLGVLYANGPSDAPRDLKRAVKYFEEAAAQQFHPAEAALGWAYSEGLGDLTPSQEEAARLFKKAADAQDPEGLYRLGYHTFLGRGGLKKDLTAARSLMRASAAKGYAPAQRWLNGHGG